MLSRAENESRNNDRGLTFEIAFQNLDMSLTNIQQEYPKSCLPNQLKKNSGTKAEQLPFEVINTDTYDAHARMVAFRIERERLELWIYIFYSTIIMEKQILSRSTGMMSVVSGSLKITNQFALT